MLRRLTVTAALAGLLLVPAASASAAGTVVTMDSAGLLQSSGPARSTYCGQHPAVPYASDGDPITVHMLPGPDFTIGAVPASWWRTPPTSDAVWQLSFRALLWLQPAAYSARDLPASYASAVGQALAFYAQDPDPGTANGLAASTAAGWDEGTSLRRLTTLNCLYSLHPDSRLLSLMQREINVQTCPRYYGPPCNVVHNHGMMANESIYQAGVVTGNTSWQKLAADRLAAEAPQVFDPSGFMKEQSSSYQAVNVDGWTSGANLIRANYPAAASSIDAVLVRGQRALRWLTLPDGHRVQIGGSSEDVPGPTDPDYTDRTLIDDTYGWAVGRWSFTDPATTFYVIRYGPSKGYHGEQDRPGVVWMDNGTRVLVEPGSYGSDPADQFVIYQRAVTSQNQAVPVGTAQANRPVTRTAATIRAGSHAYSFTDQQWPGRTHSRYVAVYGSGTPSHKILIRDTFTDDPAKTATANTVRQWWHLDPTWQLVSRGASAATFRAGNGHTLTMTTTGAVSSIARGLTSPARGWHFPKGGTKVASLEVCVDRYQGGSTVIDTSFVLS